MRNQPAPQLETDTLSSLIDSLLQEMDPAERAFIDRATTLAAEIKRQLRLKNLTQEKFGQLIGKKPSEVSKILSGRHNMTLKTMVKIEVVLGIRLLSLQLMEPEKPRRPVLKALKTEKR